MRFYELAAKIGLDKKDYHVLLDYANENGYTIKNSLDKVDNEVVTWVEKNSSQLPALIDEAKKKVKKTRAQKKRVPVRRKRVTKKTSTVKKVNEEEKKSTCCA